jgi:hypothetical protein
VQQVIILTVRNTVEGEVYLYHDRLFCPSCDMQLRLTPSSRECKEILRLVESKDMNLNVR